MNSLSNIVYSLEFLVNKYQQLFGDRATSNSQSMNKFLIGIFLITILESFGQTAVNLDDCLLTNPDTSVYNIILHDKESSMRQVGENFAAIDGNMDMPYENFCSQDKKQTLSLFFHYGGVRNSFSEFQVRQYSPSDSAVTLKTNSFVTNSGIKLGISKDKVVSILGSCFKTINNEKTKETIKYRINDFEHSIFLKRFNMPIYYAVYEFRSDKLVRFRFGFENP